MNPLLIALIALALVIILAIAAFIFEIVNKWFKVQGITYGRALLILLTYSVIQGIFKELGVSATGLAGLIDLVGFIIAIAAAYYLYKRYTSVGLGKFILVGVISTVIGTVLGIAVVVIIRLYVVQPFVVDGNSMAPTYSSNDYLVIEEWNKSAAKGDVVIADSSNHQYYIIARVAGLPGDTVDGTLVPSGDYYLSKDSGSKTDTGLVPISAIIGKPIVNLGQAW